MSKTIYIPLVAQLVFALVPTCHGAETPVEYLGANSCASSSCHGGGGAKQNQFLTWSVKDFHSQRPPATLATSRSKQIADALNITDPAANIRCTVCHAPLNSVPDNLRGKDLKVSEGVSCESCHGAAENWIRSHTRPDYTRADRVTAGMRDLQNLYVRANICVACHQNVDADILQAGHPELIFEMDGQSVAEPKHWSAERNGNGAQAWLVGQAVALREMSWQLSKMPQPDSNAMSNDSTLFWLLKIIFGSHDQDPDHKFDPANPNHYVSIQKWADDLARTTSEMSWTDVETKKCLAALSGSTIKPGSQDTEARRAGRLVLALDRLVAALPELKHDEPLQVALNQLFKLAQSIPDFDPKQFAGALQKFSAALPAQP